MYITRTTRISGPRPSFWLLRISGIVCPAVTGMIFVVNSISFPHSRRETLLICTNYNTMSVSNPSFSLEELKIWGASKLILNKKPECYKSHVTYLIHHLELLNERMRCFLHGSHPSDLCCAETQDEKDVSKSCIHLYIMSCTVKVSQLDTFVYDTTAQGNTPRPSKNTSIGTYSSILVYHISNVLRTRVL